MVILITGSSGFVGKNFIKMSTEFEILEVDLIKEKIEDVDFSGVDCVLHLAALVHQMKGAPDCEYYKINRDLAFKTAFLAKKNGVRHFIFMSTAKVYGESSGKNSAWNEDSACNPTGSYAKSKYEAENLIRNLEEDTFKVAIVRSPLVYGSGVRANMLNLVGLIKKYPVLPLGTIDNKRSMVYIGNLVELFRKIICLKASGIFIAGDQKSLTTTELCVLVAKTLNKRIFLFKMPDLLLQILKSIKPSIIYRLFGSMELDNRKTNEILGLKLPYTTEEGIKAMVDWFRA
jgi:nucleoside-diphosphate-sugar epimerase